MPSTTGFPSRDSVMHVRTNRFLTIAWTAKWALSRRSPARPINLPRELSSTLISQIQTRFERIELPAKLLDYFLWSNKSKSINNAILRTMRTIYLVNFTQGSTCWAVSHVQLEFMRQISAVSLMMNHDTDLNALSLYLSGVFHVLESSWRLLEACTFWWNSYRHLVKLKRRLSFSISDSMLQICANFQGPTTFRET
jgi:hypothetical protein